MDSRAEAYYNYFNSSNGGGTEYPVYRGARRCNPQYGAGIGDFFRGLFRSFFPVALKGASTFLNYTVRAQNEGLSIGQAAKAALRPAFGAAMTSAVEQLNSKPKPEEQSPIVQSGSGASRKTSQKRKRKISIPLYKRANSLYKNKRVKYNF